MYVVTEADAAAIREAYETGGELSAARCVAFPGIIDNATAREQARRIAAWTPLPELPKTPRRIRKALLPIITWLNIPFSPSPKSHI